MVSMIPFPFLSIAAFLTLSLLHTNQPKALVDVTYVFYL
jgi:hypothetical protein